MADRYLLPDVLGGGECARREDLEDAGWPYHRVVIIGGWIVLVPEKALTEVPPALPPEPQTPAQVVQIGASFFEKRDTGDGGINWYDVGANTWLTWEQVCSVGTPTLLIRQPIVALPFGYHTEDNDDITVHEGNRLVHLRMEVDDAGELPTLRRGRLAAWTSLTPDAGRALGDALHAAADKAESGQL